MKHYIRTTIFALTIVLVFTILILALQSIVDVKDSIAIILSLIALVVSLVSSFKNELFGFRLDVVASELVLASPTTPSHNSLALVFPLSFINRGYGEGIVESLAVKAVLGKTQETKLYTPVTEVDMMKFIQGKRRLHAENTLGTFAAFPLDTKAALKKYILFTQEERNENYPFSPWEAGEYRFEVYAKTSAGGKPHKVTEFEYEITQEILDSYFSGTSQYLSPGWTYD